MQAKGAEGDGASVAGERVMHSERAGVIDREARSCCVGGVAGQDVSAADALAEVKDGAASKGDLASTQVSGLM